MYHFLVILLYFTITYSLDILGIVDLLSQIILCGKMCSSIPGLHLRDANSTSSLSCDNQKGLHTLKYLLGDKIVPC